MPVKIDGNGFISGLAPLGQCRLDKVGTTLVLSPLDGNQLFVNGQNRPIPSGGVVLAQNAFTASAFNYVYAAWNGTAIVMEASTTAPVVETTYGTKVKTGDPSRALVGAAYAEAGPALTDTAAKRYVLSWFNKRSITAQGTFTVDRSTGGSEAGFAELNSEIRAGFICWSGLRVRLDVDANISHFGTSTNILFGPGVDSTTVPLKLSQWSNAGASGTALPASAGLDKFDLTEGLHYLTLIERSAGANAVNFLGNGTDPLRATRCTAVIQG